MAQGKENNAEFWAEDKVSIYTVTLGTFGQNYIQPLKSPNKTKAIFFLKLFLCHVSEQSLKKYKQ